MKHISIVRYVLMAASVLLVLFGWILAPDPDIDSSGVDLLLRGLYVILGLAIVCIVVFSIYALLQNPKSAVQSLIGLAVLVVVIGIAWSLSSGETVVTPTNTYTDVPKLKLADTSLFAMYIFLGGAILTVVFGELRSFFK